MTDPIARADFSVLDEPWILVRTLSGHTREVSILDAFRDATELRAVVGDIPTQGFAILRLLLAILHRAVDGPADASEWKALDAEGRAPMEQIEAYCERYRARFDLFHPATPFFQVADLRTAKDEYSGLEKLIADVPAGHRYFTTRSGAGLESISAAEAARWVVHAQAFDCSGIKSGAVGDDRVKGGRGYPIGTGWAGVLGGVYVEGENLWRTLLLNLVPTDQIDGGHADRPAWEGPPATAAQALDHAKRPYGPLDLYTWQSRRIRLRGGVDGVTGVVLANGDKLQPPYPQKLEPMTAWRRSTPQEKKLKLAVVYMPREHRQGQTFWRGVASMLPGLAPRSGAKEGGVAVAPAVFDWAATCFGARKGGRHRVTLRAVGMFYGTQSATVADVFDDQLVLSLDVLREQNTALPALVHNAVEATDRAVFELLNLASNLVKAAGGTDASLADGARARAGERAYAALDGEFRRWVEGLDDASVPDEERLRWHRIASRVIAGIGAELVAETGPAAWVGRVVGGRRITSPEAHLWFQAALRKALPVPRAESTSAESVDAENEEKIA